MVFVRRVFVCLRLVWYRLRLSCVMLSWIFSVISRWLSVVFFCGFSLIFCGVSVMLFVIVLLRCGLILMKVLRVIVRSVVRCCRLWCVGLMCRLLSYRCRLMICRCVCWLMVRLG